MTELRDLYQELILDHHRKPRNFKRLENATNEARGRNPLCGDQINLYLLVEGDRIVDIGFEGQGCAVSKASASLMTEKVKGKTLAEAEDLFTRFHDLLTVESSTQDPEELGKLAVFAGVREFPARVKCATLSWHTLKAALAKSTALVTTE
jgi:nitrogen fixation protein NifU and related proteins